MHSLPQKRYKKNDAGQWPSPAERAKRLLYQLNIEDIPIQPRQIAERLGIYVWEREIEGNYDGYLMRVGDDFGILINSAIKSEARKNFTVAHELGHYELDRNKKTNSACVIDEMYNPALNKQEESRANQFAVELLMPKLQFLADMNQMEEVGWEAIDSLAAKYCTSLTSTAIRYVRSSPHICAIVLSEENKIKYFAYSKAFSKDNNCYLLKDMPLQNGSCAKRLFDRGLNDVEEISGETPLSCWFKGNSPAMLFEHSRSLPRLKQVLSFIWLR